MAIAQSIGPSERVAIYTVPDGEMAAGSTLGGPKVCMVIKPAVGLRHGADLLVCVGSTEEHTVSVGLRLDVELEGSYRRRVYRSLTKHWVEDEDLVPAAQLREGISLRIEHRGFYLLSLQQVV